MAKWNEDNTVGAVIAVATPFVAAGLLAMMLPLWLWKAWVLAKLWGWYVVPFFGASPLGLWVAFGLCMITTLMQRPPSKPDGKGLWAAAATSFTNNALVLAFGWGGSFFL